MTKKSSVPRRALLSVSDKTGIVDFAQKLTALGYDIISTGGTKKVLEEAKIPVLSAEDVTHFPECFGGRVKTMHPMIMGGVLFRRDNPDDIKKATELGIQSIDLICVNLYPFEATVLTLMAKGNGVILPEDRATLIEQIDIGGPTLLRSAAKNHASVTVVTDPSDYRTVIDQLEKSGDTTPEFRAELAVKVFERTMAYDSAITKALSGEEKGAIFLTNRSELRYGENPHQRGWFAELYGEGKPWTVLQEEKKMSYLNILDADGAWNLVQEFSEPTSACIKHANPSGVASAKNITEAFIRSYNADRLSAFGVIIALNKICTAEIIDFIIAEKMFVEILIAPGYEPKALELLKQKPKIRVLAMASHKSHVISHTSKTDEHSRCLTYRTALGGVLIQNNDDSVVTEKDLKCVTTKKPTDDQIRDLLFAWNVVKHAKSNAIVFAKDEVTVGIGCGQTSRVDATWIAAKRAGERAKGAVMASDAFFPFPDSVEEASKHGISAIIQPGGSVKDAEVFAKAEELGIAMVTTSIRVFRH